MDKKYKYLFINRIKKAKISYSYYYYLSIIPDDFFLKLLQVQVIEALKI